MPCSFYTPGEEAEMRATALRRELDTLTAEADKLREIIIEAILTKSVPKVDAKFQREILKRQVAHRQMDLDRLEATFVKNKDHERLAKVWAADPKKPLEPQLGFDPDAF